MDVNQLSFLLASLDPALTVQLILQTYLGGWSPDDRQGNSPSRNKGLICLIAGRIKGKQGWISMKEWLNKAL